METKKYYYRFKTCTELGRLFRSFWNDCLKAERAAEGFANKVGAASYYTNPSFFAGGIECVAFDNPEKVNRKLWRSIGKDADDIELFVPDVKQREGVLLLPRRNFKPSDTANRIYSKKISRWHEVANIYSTEEWAPIAGVTLTGNKDEDMTTIRKQLEKGLYCRFTELYRDDDTSKAIDRRCHTTHAAKESIRIERARLRLPVVSVNRLFSLLETDLLDNQPNDGKPKFVRPTTPTFFEWVDKFYVGCSYPCRHKDLEEITPGVYQLKMTALQQAEKAKQELLNEI